jgi:small GTP-binding protein
MGNTFKSTPSLPPSGLTFSQPNNNEYLHHINYDYLIKMLIIGDSKVGKTSILNQLKDKKIKEDYKPTIGIDFCTHIIQFDRKITNYQTHSIQSNVKDIKLQIFDTDGSPRNRHIRSSYFRGSFFILIVCDLSEKSSLDNLFQHIDDAKQYGSQSAPVYIIGNKSDKDIDSQNREDAKRIAEENNFKYFEVSASTGVGVEHLFQNLDYGHFINNRDEESQHTDE